MMMVIKIMDLAERLRIGIETLHDANNGKCFFEKLTQTNPNAKDDEENTEEIRDFPSHKEVGRKVSLIFIIFYLLNSS